MKWEYTIASSVLFADIHLVIQIIIIFSVTEQHFYQTGGFSRREHVKSTIAIKTLKCSLKWQLILFLITLYFVDE